MSGKKILVVEDEVMVAMTLEDTLEALGYEVVGTADNGGDAVRLAIEKEPDLILMDIRIRGDIDGIEAAERIAETLDIPVVFLTAHSDEQTLMRALKTQPYGFLIKPFRERELYSNIEMAIHKHRVLKKRSQTEETAPRHVEAPPFSPPPVRSAATATDSNALKGLVFESLTNPVFVMNRDLKIVLYNNKFTELCSFLNIPESIFRASAEKAGIFPLLGASNDYRGVFIDGRVSTTYHNVMSGDAEHSLKITKIPLKGSSGIMNVMAVIEDVTYEKMLRESGDLYHETAESVIKLSNELKNALKGHDDPVLSEIADTSDEMVLRFARMDEEWLRIRAAGHEIKDIWES
ncbi:MAG: response regulator [Methanomicrobiaceae archaeon]|nr:response regulator [Methanomicrobiaceae archaeon]